MTLTAAMYAALPGVRLPDATSWALPDTHSVGAFWNVATRQWDVLELAHEHRPRWPPTRPRTARRAMAAVVAATVALTGGLGPAAIPAAAQEPPAD